MMTGQEFVSRYASRGQAAWEAAALEIAGTEGLTPWPWAEFPLTDGENTVVLRIMTDVVAIGTLDDHVRLPMTPGGYQSILNLFGWLLPTPWLVYQTWRAAANRLPFPPMPVNADLRRYLERSLRIDASLAGAPPGIASGASKDVVASNLWLPGKVVIHGAYLPDGPDTFSNGLPMNSVGRQPLQPESNLHASSYCDDSHSARAVDGVCLVDGNPTATEDVYRSATLHKLVSASGPIGRGLRYPASVPPRVMPIRSLGPAFVRPAAIDAVVPLVPSRGQIAAAEDWSDD